MHPYPNVLYVVQKKMFKILLSSTQRGCDIVSNINKLFAPTCFSDDGCCPFVFKLCFIKAKMWKEEKQKKTLFTRTRAGNYLDKMLLSATNYSVFVPYREHPTFSLSYFAHIIILMCFSLCSVCAILNYFHCHRTGIPPLNILVSFHVL
jgi:hypothetical protein